MERLSVSNSIDYSPAEFGIHLARYLPVRELVRGRRVLDIGCGEGYASAVMKSRWAAQEVLGLDIDVASVKSARRRFSQSGLSYHASDVNEFLESRSRSFDVVTCVETIEHLESPETTVGLIDTVAKRASYVYITCPNDVWYYGQGESLNPFHSRSYTLQEFRELTEAVLGPATCIWLGGIASGFVTIPSIPVVSDSWERSLSQITLEPTLSGALLPAAKRDESSRLSPANALYFCALWVRNLPIPSLVTSAALWPSSPEYRLRTPGLIPSDIRSGTQQSIVFIVEEDWPAARQYASALESAVAGKLETRFLLVNEGNRESVLQSVLFQMNPRHVHFFNPRMPHDLFTSRHALQRFVNSSQRRADAVVEALSRPILTFSDMAGDMKDDKRFWRLAAPYFDSFCVNESEYSNTSFLRSGFRIPHLVSDARHDRIPWTRSWLAMLRAANGSSSSGVRMARAAHLRFLLDGS